MHPTTAKNQMKTTKNAVFLLRKIKNLLALAIEKFEQLNLDRRLKIRPIIIITIMIVLEEFYYYEEKLVTCESKSYWNYVHRQVDKIDIK